MKLQSQLTLRPDFLYLAPLLNIVLLLLIFFLLNSNLVLRSGYRVELPESHSSLRPVDHAHIVTITAGETPKVYLDDAEVVTGDLTARLRRVRDQSRYVIVNADGAAPHGVALRVYDAIRAADCDIAIGTATPEP